MKKHFSNKWKASRQPRKQVKYRANAPLHTKHKFMSANLDKDLRKKYGKRSFPLRKGDSVKILRGEFKKKIGKIGLVNLKRLRVAIENIQKTKKDGSKVNIWFDPSNLQVKELNLDDKKRLDSLQRKNKPITSKPEETKNGTPKKK
ncbi:MAG: 50S ribosomal protein L24 [Candidatus Nanoarchaeia archaeon]|nr:50S ribosomal protein L24 [Candidatus Nanoarchaeia archaeon]MDD5741721.1 50S ribosomal protein L24 [Candidatus Nanoarchaeia archaeon]